MNSQNILLQNRIRYSTKKRKEHHQQYMAQFRIKNIPFYDSYQNSLHRSHVSLLELNYSYNQIIDKLRENVSNQHLYQCVTNIEEGIKKLKSIHLMTMAKQTQLVQILIQKLQNGVQRKTWSKILKILFTLLKYEDLMQQFIEQIQILMQIRSIYCDDIAFLFLNLLYTDSELQISKIFYRNGIESWLLLMLQQELCRNIIVSCQLIHQIITKYKALNLEPNWMPVKKILDQIKYRYITQQYQHSFNQVIQKCVLMHDTWFENSEVNARFIRLVVRNNRQQQIDEFYEKIGNNNWIVEELLSCIDMEMEEKVFYVICRILYQYCYRTKDKKVIQFIREYLEFKWNTDWGKVSSLEFGNILELFVQKIVQCQNQDDSQMRTIEKEVKQIYF